MGSYRCSFPHLTSWHPRQMRSRGRGEFLLLKFFVLHARSACFLVISLVHTTSSCDRPGRMAKGSLQRAATARTADRKRTAHNNAMISIGRMRVMMKKHPQTAPLLFHYE